MKPYTFFYFFLSYLIIASFVGCATYQTKVAPAHDYLKLQDCTSALNVFEPLAAKEDGDQLVHLMDYGTALQICNDTKKSSQVFLKAEALSENVDYHSVSRIAGATLLNEEMIQYKGDTFEKLFLNVSLALNFIQENKLDSALVEVRKMNQKFTKLNSEKKKDFELNSFSKYLSGLIWESQKKYDDACIDYKDAYFTDTAYRQVGIDMLRACWLAKRTSEFETLTKKMSATAEEIKIAKNTAQTELIVVFMQGWGPKKTTRYGDGTFPTLQKTYSKTKYLQISTPKENFISSEIYSVENAAIKTLEDDYASLVARRIGARVAKEVVADQIRQKDQLLGAAAWLVMVASERADLRQWSTLPAEIHIMRVPLTPGEHTLTATGLGTNKEKTELWPDLKIKIKKGEKKITLIRSLK